MTKSRAYRQAIINLSTIFLAAATLLALFDECCQLGDIVGQSKSALCLISVLLLAVSLAARLRMASATATLLLIINLVPFFRLYSPISTSGEHAGTHFRLLEVNLNAQRNKNYQAVSVLISEKKPDLVGFLEVTKDWDQFLTNDLKAYKYRVVEQRFGGMALFSKYPLRFEQKFSISNLKRPRLNVIIDVGERALKVNLVHLATPHQGRFALRSADFTTVALENVSSANTVLFGDFNCTPTTSKFKKLLQTTALNDTERGFGFQPSWPANLNFPMFPIDHVLISKDIFTAHRAIGPNIGSDHLPVFVDLIFPLPEKVGSKIDNF